MECPSCGAWMKHHTDDVTFLEQDHIQVDFYYGSCPNCPRYVPVITKIYQLVRGESSMSFEIGQNMTTAVTVVSLVSLIVAMVALGYTEVAVLTTIISILGLVAGKYVQQR